MPNAKISELATASPLDYTELLALVQEGVTRKVVLGKLFPELFQLACSNRIDALAAADNVASFRAPFPFSVYELFAELDTVSSSGAVTVRIEKNGTTIFSTNLTIDASEGSSLTAATPYVLSGTINFVKGDICSVDIIGEGTGAMGLIVTILGLRNGL